MMKQVKLSQTEGQNYEAEEGVRVFPSSSAGNSQRSGYLKISNINNMKTPTQ
jgi:hypothetical protein